MLLKFKKVLLFFMILFSASVALAESITEKQLHRRIYMLEIALAPVNPEAVAITWAEAAKSRNGAIQYMVMCQNLQKANIANLKALNWVTGISSPWISDYKIISQKNLSAFDIRYQFSDSSGKMGAVVDHLKVEKVSRPVDSSQKWCISQFNALSPIEKLKL